MFTTAAIWTSLAWCACFPTGPEPGPESGPVGEPARPLVDQLGAPRFLDREQAAAALEKLGDKAVPTLRLAKASRDPEIRLRADAVITRIERRKLSSPTLVKLDFRDRPVAEIVDALAERSQHRLKLAEDLDESERRRRVTLVDDELVPFWEAVERLCSQVNIRTNLSTSFDPREPASITFDMPWGSSVRPIVAVDGPFRAQLPRGTPSRELQRFGAGRPINSIVFNLVIHPEPGILIRATDAPRIIEAIDDRGQSLESADVDEFVAFQNRRFDNVSQGASANAPLKLVLPKNPARFIKHLKIAVPISIAARRNDPTEIVLADAAGKAFPVDNGLIRVSRVATEPGGLIEISVADFDSAAEDRRQLLARQAGFGRPGPFDGTIQDPQTRLSLVDRDGNPCRWEFEQPEVPLIRGRFRRRFPFPIGEQKLYLRLADDSPPAVKLLHRGIIETETEALFEFDHVPLP